LNRELLKLFIEGVYGDFKYILVRGKGKYWISSFEDLIRIGEMNSWSNVFLYEMCRERGNLGTIDLVPPSILTPYSKRGILKCLAAFLVLNDIIDISTLSLLTNWNKYWILINEETPLIKSFKRHSPALMAIFSVLQYPQLYRKLENNRKLAEKVAYILNYELDNLPTEVKIGREKNYNLLELVKELSCQVDFEKIGQVPLPMEKVDGKEIKWILFKLEEKTLKIRHLI